MLSKLKPVPRAIVIFGSVAILGYGALWAMENTSAAKYFAPKPTIAVAVPDKIDLPAAVTESGATGTTINAPAVASETIRVKTLAWNGAAGIAGAKAMGLYKAKGLDVKVVREDDYSKMIADLAAFGKDNSQGVHFVVIMGDGFPGFVQGANAALKPFGSSVKGIAGIGYSRGEDKCILAAGADPRGSLIKGVLGDGDINICIKFASDNGIPVNADPKVYVPTAMNFSGAASFVEADQAFIASAKADYKGGACEDRVNTETGRKQSVCVNGTATWTPGDTNVFNQLKKIGKSIRVLASTKEYAWQMPTLVIGNSKWMAANRPTVKAFLAATLDAGERIRTDSGALMKAAAEQAIIIGEEDASYWASLYKGTTDTGPDGKVIALGGSTTNGISDAAFLFGLNGADNLYKKVYTVYGNIAVKYFPDTMNGGLLKYEDAVDASYIQELMASSTNATKAAVPTYSATTTSTFAAKAVSVEFETGKATFTAATMATLNEILDSAAVTTLNVQINGHTDNKGNPVSNLALSKARAEAVKTFLMTNAPSSFPADRVQTRGYGDTQPIGTDAQNRRVEILLRK